MNGTTWEAKVLQAATEDQAVRNVLERHGVAWLADTDDSVTSGQLLEQAAAISGVAPAELERELQQAIEHVAIGSMMRQLSVRNTALAEPLI